jgi:hypothetical protein
MTPIVDVVIIIIIINLFGPVTIHVYNMSQFICFVDGLNNVYFSR